jgi:hypothetical protein
MKAITNIFAPQFDITAVPLKEREESLYQLFGHIGVFISHDEFLCILVEWFDSIELAKLREAC